MSIAFFLDRFQNVAQEEALIWRDQAFLYQDLLGLIAYWQQQLTQHGIKEGAVVGLQGTFSPDAVALLFALLQQNCIVALLSDAALAHRTELLEAAEAEWLIEVNQQEQCTIHRLECQAQHPLLQQLRQQSHPGIIIFTSGSTGKSKAALHDGEFLLKKFQTPRPALRTLLFLLFDHIGGFNTLCHVLANGSCAVVPTDHSPEAVATAIARHAVQLLPTSPTFLTLLLLNEAHRRYNLSSLEAISYGTEVMPEDLLQRLNECFPNVRFLQSYGTTELGILRAKSRASNSRWVKVGGEGFETRIVDGLLEIKAQSAMLGYLNAPSPFTSDGWYMTGDAVERDGEWLRFLGRKSEIINVGGQKVYPAEVENVLQMMDGVAEVVVKGETNAITGHIVSARVRLAEAEPLRDFRTRMHAFCKDKLEPYKIPVRVTLVAEPLHTARFKKSREG